jgi:hypothetical protein
LDEEIWLHVKYFVISCLCTLLKRSILSRSFSLYGIYIILIRWNWYFNRCNWHWRILFFLIFSLKRPIIIILTLIIRSIIEYLKRSMVWICRLSKKWRRELILLLRYFRIVPNEIWRSILLFAIRWDLPLF